MKSCIAEIIAIGDELVSGQRLDTNSQWIGRQLAELGITVSFHSTVGDNLAHKEVVFRNAVRRANVVICSGGLGPTADDLTRDVIANVAGVPLRRNFDIIKRIREMYRTRNREMPESNLRQADFPAGSTVIDNPEGTAPGIDFTFKPISERSHECRLFALPGVPAELKQMWVSSVRPALQELTGSTAVILHRSLHVFGEGESKIEAMLPDLVKRGNDPATGITASAATITLRVSTSGVTKTECDKKIEPVLQTIRDCLGDLVFGADDQTLADVVVESFIQRGQTLAILDGGLYGEVATALTVADPGRKVLRNAVLPAPLLFYAHRRPTSSKNDHSTILSAAKRIKDEWNTDFGLAVEPINRQLRAVEQGKSTFLVGIVGPDSSGQTMSSVQRNVYRGHSSWRQQRAVKQVLNQLRLMLKE